MVILYRSGGYTIFLPSDLFSLCVLSALTYALSPTPLDHTHHTGLLDKAVKNKYMFLAVEQSIRYSRPIQPFQRYVVATTCTVYDDNKWLWYKHTFEQHPDDVKPGQEPREYAVIDLKAVLKEQSGKTIKPSDQLDASEFSKELFVFKKGTKIFPFQEPEEVIETQTEGQGEGQELGAGIRARDEFGRFLGDDVGTKEWNEAWVDGKSPAKK